MLSFQYNPQLSTGANVQYQTYLLDQEFNGTIPDVARSVLKRRETNARDLTRSAQEPLSNPSSKRARDMYQIAQLIAGSFNDLLPLVNQFISRIETATPATLLNVITALEWRTAIYADKQLVSKILAEDLKQVFRVADTEKNWIDRLEKGLLLYTQATYANSNYEQATSILQNLISAAKHKHGSYLLQMRMGMIHLYVPSLLEPANAESYFLNSAEAVGREINMQTKPLLCKLLNLGDEGLSIDFDKLKKMVATEALYQAGVACYVRGTYSRAKNYLETANSFTPRNDTDLMLAKVLLFMNQPADAMRILNRLLRADELYLLSIALDPTFSTSPHALSAFTQLRNYLHDETKVKAQTYAGLMIANSQAQPIVAETQKLLGKNDFYSLLKANQNMDKPRKWKVMPAIFTEKRVFNEHPLRVNSIAFSPDGKTLACASWKTTLNDIQSGLLVQSFMGYESSETINALAFSPDGAWLATGGSNKSVLIWDVRTGELAHSVELHDQTINALAFSPDSQRLASADADGIVYLIDVKTGSKKEKLKGHKSSVTALAFNPLGTTLLSAGQDHAIVVWDVKKGKKIEVMDHHEHTISGLSFSRDGKTFASSSWDKLLILWNSTTNKPIKKFTGHKNGVDSISFIFEDKLLVSTSYNRATKICEIKVWDVESGTEIQSAFGRFYAALFSPDGSNLAIASSDKTVRVVGAPEMPLKNFLLFERQAADDRTRALASASQKVTKATGDERRKSSDRRQNHFWIGGVDLRNGKDRRDK
jgi:WD40 repeat protein/tetratricopeptide (TPR) repeat protein